jgi:hypothetical protein
MVATGPRPPMTIGGNRGGDEPLKINLGEGMMGEFWASTPSIISQFAVPWALDAVWARVRCPWGGDA